MKKILIIAAGVLCSVAVYVGVNSYNNNAQTSLLTQNIEALTQGEGPSFDKYLQLTYNCYDEYGQRVGTGVSCSSPGYLSSCSSSPCR